jgi:hypothetical protein
VIPQIQSSHQKAEMGGARSHGIIKTSDDHLIAGLPPIQIPSVIDAVVALLLPFLPDVQKWTVGDIVRPAYVGKAIQRAEDGIFGFITVTQLEILADPRYNNAAWADYNFSSFHIFQDLPSSQSISEKGIGGIGIEDAGTHHDISCRASPVREIHLRDCELSCRCLSRIIGFSTGLEAFTYRFGGRAGDGGTASVFLPQLAKALRGHTLMVRSLDIDIDDLLVHQTWELELNDEEDAGADHDSKGYSDTQALESADSKALAQEDAGWMAASWPG